MRSIPVQFRPLPPHPLHRSHSQDLFCSGEPLVILFPRRFSRPTIASGVVGFLSEICTVRLGFPAPPSSPPSPSLFPSPFPLPRSGQRVFSRKRIWKWRWSLRVSGSFCFCSALHRGIGNAYFITLRCFAGRRLFAVPVISVLRLLELPLTHVFNVTILIAHV